jgi:hypothetical protein
MSTTRTRRAPHTLAAGALLSLFLTTPAIAQQGIGGQAFRTSLGATLLMPTGGEMTMDSARLPSGRAVLEIQSNPVFGFHLGALRMAPNVAWSDSSAFGGLDAPHYQLGLTAGIVGFRLNFTTGRFRIAPFVDGGAGLAQVRMDQGGYFYQDGGLTGYQPAYLDTMTVMAGGGGGVAVDAIIGPGLTLSLLGGYWHFQSMETNDAGDPLVDPMSGAWLGAGVKLAFRDMAYYWRHSGQDSDPPVLQILSPAADGSGVVDVGEPRTTLSLRAMDPATVDSIFVNGRKLTLVPVRGSEIPTVDARADLTLRPGPNMVSYLAFDGAGNRLEGEWEILGIPLDQEGPRIAFIQPENDLSIMSERVLVEAVIADRSPVEQVTLNGLSVRPVEGTAEDRTRIGAGPEDFVYRFQSSTNVPTAEFRISVAAVDSAGNTQIEGVTIRRADLAVAAAPVQQQPAPAQPATRGPEIEIHLPAEWAGGGTRGFAAEPKQSIRVAGIARYQEGIQEVLANNKRMSVQRDPNNAAMVQFSGFVEPPPAGSQGEVEILVRGRDGSQSVRTYTTRTAEAVAAGPAQFENIAGARNRERWAVIIGVSEYQDGTIGNLQYADDDARAVYNFFRSEQAGMGGIPESNIRLLVNEDATARNIRSAMTTFLRQSTPDDVIFIYIAGHGAPDPYRPDDLYILAHDTEIEDIAATGVNMNDVNRAIQDAYAYNKVLITDACHSAGVGSGTRALSNNQINAAFLDYMNNSSGGFVAFTASESNQLSQEGEQFGGGHGVFTYYFLEGLRGAADLPEHGGDGDLVVTLGELMEYTRDRVRRQTRNAQIPTISLTTYDRFWPMAAVLDDGGAGEGATQQ